MGDMQKGRIGIFVFYDEDGIADRYEEYFLADLRHNLERLIIVCNGKLQVQSREKLSVYADQILERENEGYDIWAYKAGIELLGWEEICRYDELVLCNDTVFGPIYPFCEMFREMGKKDVDFWGITKHESVRDNPFAEHPGEELKEHIQSYFTVFRRKVLEDKQFREYWDKLPEIHSYAEAVNRYEARLTAWLAERGYRYDVYVNTEAYREYTANPIMMCPDLLVKNERCPVVKRRVFTADYGVLLHDTIGNAPSEVLKFLEEESSYDVNLIWENILRVGRQTCIADNLQLHYVLNEDEECEDINDVRMMVILSPEQKERLAGLLPAELAVCTINRESLLTKEGEREPDKYDFLCLLPDVITDNEVPNSVSADWERSRLLHLADNDKYLRQVVRCFRQNRWLGALYPPMVCHGWKPGGVSTSECGWFRREALEDLLQKADGRKTETHHRFYSATVYNKKGLSAQLTNEAYCLKRERERVEQCEEQHNRVAQEWQKTAEQLKECREAHDRVVEEWTKTAEQLKECREAHDRVVEEWTKTADALRQLQAENEALKQTKAYKIAKIWNRNLK